VFQHLSNAEINRALEKIEKYRFALVTEHQPAPTHLVRPNIDKPHGGDTRVHEGSGVYLDQPPFSRDVAKLLESRAESPLIADGETITTVMLRGCVVLR
jgi:hypothetical protein